MKNVVLEIKFEDRAAIMYIYTIRHQVTGMGRSRGGTGCSGPPPPHLENHKAKGFLAILVWVPWKKTELSSQHFQCWTMIGLPAKRHLNGVWLAGR